MAYGITKDREWDSNSREAKRVSKLGIVAGDTNKLRVFRNGELEKLDAYYEGRQHAGKMTWDQAADSACDGDYIPVRKRQPKILANYAKVMCDRVASKLVGEMTFPTFRIEDDPDTEDFIRMVIQASKLKSRIIEPMRRMLAAGSVLVRFYYVEGGIKIEKYLSKFCYPQFSPLGELLGVTIKYVYPDKNDKDEKGNPKLKWFKMDLGPISDILYDNPPYDPNASGEPEFKIVSKVDHNFGFVQAEWFSTCEPDADSPDGESLICPVLNMIDDESYSMSQSSQAISYNQDPQLTLTGLDTDEISGLIRSSQKAWNLGREGEAKFVETNLGAVERAKETRQEVKLLMQDLTRVIFLDPEKFSAQAMSGKAMEILHGPLVELINELRPVVEASLVNLILKISVSMLILNEQGADVPVDIPQGFKPTSLSLTAVWPPIFPMTMTDLKEKLGVGIQASNANIISRDTILKWVAPDFGIEDVEEEIAKIAAQPVLNPFGTF